MPLIETNNISADRVDELIKAIKSDADFWSEDAAERASDEYKGFGSVRNNIVSTDYNNSDFPVLFVYAIGLNKVNTAGGSYPIGADIALRVAQRYQEGDANISAAKKHAELLLLSVEQTFSLHSKEKTLIFEDVLGSYKTHNIESIIELNNE